MSDLKSDLESYVLKCLSQCSVAVKRHHDQGISLKRKHLTMGLLTVSEVSLFHHGREYGSRQAGGVILERSKLFILIYRQ